MVFNKFNKEARVSCAGTLGQDTQALRPRRVTLPFSKKSTADSKVLAGAIQIKRNFKTTYDPLRTRALHIILPSTCEYRMTQQLHIQFIFVGIYSRSSGPHFRIVSHFILSACICASIAYCAAIRRSRKVY